MMKLRLVRTTFTPNSTIGHLYVVSDDGSTIQQCFTLEDTVRDGAKVFGETAIPYGTYRVVIDHSAHFNRELPHVLDVPGFDGIRIHSGNRPEDTEGCILVGLRIPPDKQDWIDLSHAAFDPLFLKMQSTDEITLDIVKE